MSFTTNLEGRLRNTLLPPQNALLPLFEAVVNSIHAIEEKTNNLSHEKIDIQILRAEELELTSEAPINGFSITDTGIGFNEENMKSFFEFDTSHKRDKGCKGIGRLSWLKVFDKVDISSIYQEDNEIRKREFKFPKQMALNFPKYYIEDSALELRTTVTLKNIDEKYIKHIPDDAEKLSSELLEHCLWYFIRPAKVPQITVIDGSKSFNLNDMFKSISIQEDRISIKNNDFDIRHIKFNSCYKNRKSFIAYCANERVVENEELSGKNIPGLQTRLSDENGHEYTYSCYVSSDVLNNAVKSERTTFSLPDDVSELLPDEISKNEIKNKVIENIRNFLSKDLKQNLEKSTERILEYVNNKDPHFKPLLKLLDIDSIYIDDKTTNQQIHAKLAKREFELRQKAEDEGRKIRQAINDNDTSCSIEGLSEKIDAYVGSISSLNQSTLTQYVCHRKSILDLFEKSLESKNGKYQKEKIIHNLFIPMGKDSHEIDFTEQANLWLIDERLVFHNYIASDKPLSMVGDIKSDSIKQPDIVSFKDYYDTPILISDQKVNKISAITLIEFKRPMRDDAREYEKTDPIKQCIDYLTEIRLGKIVADNGRLINNAQSLPAYCYIICDLTPKIIDLCDYNSLTRTYDGTGYFGYKPNYNAYVSVLGFDHILTSAQERNYAFFKKLGILND